MPFQSALGSGTHKIMILYDYSVDKEALELNTNVYLPFSKASKLLDEFKEKRCTNDHNHTCALSITNGPSFGQISVFVRIPCNDRYTYLTNE